MTQKKRKKMDHEKGNVGRRTQGERKRKGDGIFSSAPATYFPQKLFFFFAQSRLRRYHRIGAPGVYIFSHLHFFLSLFFAHASHGARHNEKKKDSRKGAAGEKQSPSEKKGRIDQGAKKASPHVKNAEDQWLASLSKQARKKHLTKRERLPFVRCERKKNRATQRLLGSVTDPKKSRVLARARPKNQTDTFIICTNRDIARRYILGLINNWIGMGKGHQNAVLLLLTQKTGAMLLPQSSTSAAAVAAVCIAETKKKTQKNCWECTFVPFFSFWDFFCACVFFPWRGCRVMMFAADMCAWAPSEKMRLWRARQPLQRRWCARGRRYASLSAGRSMS